MNQILTRWIGISIEIRIKTIYIHTSNKPTSILGKIKTIKSSNKKNKESFSQVNGNNSSPNGNSNEKIQLGFSMEGLKETGGSINDMNTDAFSNE